VTVFDNDTNAMRRTLAVGVNPGPGTASSGGGTVYIPNRGSASVAVINARRGTLTATINVGPNPSTPALAGSRLYVSSQSAGTVSVVDLSRQVWPSAPRRVAAAAIRHGAVISWRAPKTSGAAKLARYVVTASVGGRTCTTTRTSCTIRHLPTRARVTFEVRASTRVATGPAGTSNRIRVR
jgi:YVTN family beta-propeller protein